MFVSIQAKQMEYVLKKNLDHNVLAGASFMIIKDGEELLYHEDGLADREAGTPIKRDTIFRLYSMTKPVTAAAVMMLLERGEIDLCDPVSQYLEGFHNQMVQEGNSLVPAVRDATIQDLLSMTSGLVYGGEDRAGRDTMALFREIDRRLLGDSPIGTVEAMNMLGKCALAYHPGASWQYGTSADVLGAVVEVASGKRFGQFLKDELFDPLGMKDTGFFVSEDKRCRLARAYSDNGKGGLEPYTGNNLGIIYQMDRDPAFESGGAGLVSTIDDYARFARMLISHGTLDGVQVLHAKTVEYMTSSTLNHVQQKSFDLWPHLCGHSYGNLMRIVTDGGKAPFITSPGEYGWDGWLGAYFCNCPREKLTFMFMMQKTDAGTTALTRKLRNIVLSACTNETNGKYW